MVVRMKNVKFRGMQKDEFRGKFRDSNSAEKTQIPRAVENCGPYLLNTEV